MVGGTNNQSKDQVPTSWVLLFRVQENKQTVPMDGVWGHKSRTIPRFFGPGQGPGTFLKI